MVRAKSGRDRRDRSGQYAWSSDVRRRTQALRLRLPESQGPARKCLQRARQRACVLKNPRRRQLHPWQGHRRRCVALPPALPCSCPTGAYGKVRLGTHRITSSRVAIKQIPKSMSAVLTREIHHHRQLHHPHVTQMYEVIATESSIWIVTELCCGGELFDYLVEKGRLAEDEAKIIFGQLCLAVAYLHDKGIVHRDLKLENVLLDERCRVKLGDFGFTREYERGAFMETFCGTTGYAAPEMLQRNKYMGPGMFS